MSDVTTGDLFRGKGVGSPVPVRDADEHGHHCPGSVLGQFCVELTVLAHLDDLVGHHLLTMGPDVGDSRAVWRLQAPHLSRTDEGKLMPVAVEKCKALDEQFEPLVGTATLAAGRLAASVEVTH